MLRKALNPTTGCTACSPAFPFSQHWEKGCNDPPSVSNRAGRKAVRTIRAAGFVCLILLLLMRAQAQSAPRGLWLLPRKDTQNTARADVPGRMKTAPKEVWRYGGDTHSYAYLSPVRVRGKEAYFAQVRSGVRLVRPDGTLAWNLPKIGAGMVIAVEDFDSDGQSEALLTLGQTALALLDVETGKTRWVWSPPSGTFVGSHKIWRQGRQARFICFPQNAVRGVCLDLTHHDSRPKIVWERDYPDTYWQGYGPLIVLADMDNDGLSDVVLASKPGYIAVMDAETGRIKFDIHHDITGGDHAGRPYGLLTATDMDGDGFRDVAMLSCQVEEYATILRNEGGKRFQPLWSQFFEHDLPDDFRELRPNVTSLADVNGDGRKELVVGLFNITGDNRWHVVVVEPMQGFQARLTDLPDRYFWGCYDLNGDGRPEIITSTETKRRTASEATLQAVDGRTFRDIATVERAAFALSGAHLPDETGFMAIRSTPHYVQREDGKRGLLLLRHDGKPSEAFWHIRRNASEVEPYPIRSLSRAVLLSTGSAKVGKRDRTLPVRDRYATYAASAPLVGFANGKPELVFALSNGTVMGGQPDFTSPGKFKTSWSVPGGTPALWVGPNGERVVCTVQDESIHLSKPPPGPASPPHVVIKLPYPLYRHSATRTGATLIPFGAERMRLYVGLQTGVHTLASALYDAEGKTVWFDEKEGPYPRTAAVADLQQRGGYDILVDNHGKHLFYDLAGKSRLIAHGWNNTVPGRGDGAKYVVPIVGPFGPDGALRILMASGLQTLEVLDAGGRRLAKRDFAAVSEFEWSGPAVGRIRDDGHWDLGMVNQEGVFHCIDVMTCQTRWTFPTGCRATLPVNVVSGDLDGDGRDNFLMGMPDGDLIALDEQNGAASVLWKITFDYGVREAILADVDGDSLAEIVVELEDGSIRILKGGNR